MSDVGELNKGKECKSSVMRNRRRFFNMNFYSETIAFYFDVK